MASERYEIVRRGVRFPQAYQIADEEIGIHWNGRHGSGARIELLAWMPCGATRTYKIGLGDLLRGLGLTLDDCAEALADPAAAERSGA